MKTFAEIKNYIHQVAKSLIPSDVFYTTNNPFYVLSEIVSYARKDTEIALDKMKKSLFIHSAETIEDILEAGSNFNLVQNKATIAQGRAIIQGTVGTKIPINEIFLFNGNEYYTTTYTEVFDSSNNPIESAEHISGTVYITTNIPHGLASNIKINVSGFTDNNYNGNNLIINVIDEYSFSYEKAGITNNPTNLGVYSLNYAVLEIKSSEVGLDKNIASGESLSIQNEITDLETLAYVTYNSIDGGSDDEDIESLRIRGLQLTQSINSPYGKDYFKNKILEINNVDIVKILEVTPSLGFATIVFTVKNYSSPIPSGTFIQLVKDKINEIKSPVMNLENYIVEAPSLVIYNISLTSSSIINTYQKDMAIGVIQGYFLSLDIGTPPSQQTLKNLIDTTPDINGEYIKNSILTLNTSGTFTQKSIASIGNITF